MPSLSGETVSIVAVHSQAVPRAKALSLQLGLGKLCDIDTASGLVLEVSQSGLGLRDYAQRRSRTLTIDSARRRYPGSGRDLLSRALGRNCQSVIDATAGFGSDAFDFVRRGKQVCAIERVAIVAIMLKEAAADFSSGREKGNLHVVCGDAIDEIGAQAAADIIFLDPMFPDRDRQSARPRKAQQILRRLTGEDLDAGELLRVARQHAGRRVIVKRPRTAPPLDGEPDISHKGRSVRYDVYLTGGT
ncbi:MAG: class I SAM-dependent methyltransferase [Arenicellales bacterium]|nr:class I SAM-dependent methyltransferase [Arenicellales bacterium]MDP6791223.1 class I SAM-dependent methyltransferase [Arenicellales bacterium]MDP6917840.1 class I SAM-dependent methyltransferase [Arenicellales bacterium]